MKIRTALKVFAAPPIAYSRGRSPGQLSTPDVAVLTIIPGTVFRQLRTGLFSWECLKLVSLADLCRLPFHLLYDLD